jgi:hypothetical protein
LSASDVGADASGTASSAVSTHNTNTSAHADIRQQISQLSSEKVDKEALTLGLYSDGKYYIFVNGAPVGTGLEFTKDDVFGSVDENNNIILNGNLADGTYTVKYEMENGETVNIGNLVLDTNVYYSITKNLTYCSINNSATKVVEGEPYSATISANEGYELKSVTVTMGGSPVSVSGGVINIASVTGNIVITAVAEVKEVAPTYTNIFNPTLVTSDLLNKRVKSDGSVVDCVGHFVVPHILISDKVPFTDSTKIYVKGATFDKTSDNNPYAKVLTYRNKAAAGANPYSNEYSGITYSVLGQVDEGNDVISVSGDSVRQAFTTGIKYVAFCLKVKNTTITASDIQNIVITIDEPIV